MKIYGKMEVCSHTFSNLYGNRRKYSQLHAPAALFSGKELSYTSEKGWALREVWELQRR
jgi:hypothetical protein